MFTMTSNKPTNHKDGTKRRQAQPWHAEDTWLEPLMLEGTLSRGGEGFNVNLY